MLISMFCNHRSINELIQINNTRELRFVGLFQKREYVPKMHGLRDCIIDTNSKQIENINKQVIQKAKENKIFSKNKVDGLTVMAWDGVEFNETQKDIERLPEREHHTGETGKYIKYVCAMNVGERANIILASKQLLEVEKITSKTGKERAKTIGETTAFKKMWNDVEKEIGGVIDVHVFDALYLNQPVIDKIIKANKYYVIRMKDEKRCLYKDAKGLFETRDADEEYEIVEIITTKKIKYSKKAKHKDYEKTKIKKEKRKITNKKLNEKELISKKVSEKKNSVVVTEVYKRVIARKQVWSDEFNIEESNEKIRVIKALEKTIKNNKEIIQEIYVATNMLAHPIETILKIMHLRWHIENNGFRTLKQQYNIKHIFIGNLNAIDYIVQMIFLVFNLKELYTKFRLKEKIKETYQIIKRIFESELRNDKKIWMLFEGG